MGVKLPPLPLPKKAYRDPAGPVATIGQIMHHDADWFWAHCPLPCIHRGALPWHPIATRLGTEASTDRIRRALRCTVCGRQGGTIQVAHSFDPRYPPSPLPLDYAPAWVLEWISQDDGTEDVCNDYRRRQAYYEYLDRMRAFRKLNLDLVFPPASAAPNLEPKNDIMPKSRAPIFRRLEDGSGLEMIEASWSLVPWFYKGKLKEWKATTFNAKGEELDKKPAYREAFKRRRCLIPADGWYEFKGERYPKDKYLFTARDEPWFCFAGLWDHAETGDGPIDSFTMVTQAPGPAMRPYHHRAPVVLREAEWPAWLDLSADVRPILMRESEDRFDVVQVR